MHLLAQLTPAAPVWGRAALQGDLLLLHSTLQGTGPFVQVQWASE